MILRSLPEEVLKQLCDRESRTTGKTTKPVYYNGFRIDFIPGKFIRVARRKQQSWLTIHDVGGFFQSSFVAALGKWEVGTAEQLEFIQRGKDARGAELLADHDFMVQYNKLECELLEELMTKVRKMAGEVGYSIAPYEGAGCLAQNILKRHLRKAPPLPPQPVLDAAQAAYSGGWFERAVVGPVNSTVTEFDIVSAYPYAMLSLPCLNHGTWRYGGTPEPLHLAHIEWWPNGTLPTGVFAPFQHRDSKGRMTHPLTGRGWVWSVELPRNSRFSWKVLDTVSYVKQCECQPYEWVRDLFEKRRQMGKSGKGIVIKLGINSLYGKTAQSIGRASWANPVYASLITATTRASIYGLALELERNSKGVIRPVMFATDAVFVAHPADVDPLRYTNCDLSGELGSWESLSFSNLHIVKPGVYFDPSGQDGFKMKTRGIQARIFKEAVPRFIEAFERDGVNASVRLPYQQFTGLRLAVSQNRPNKAGRFNSECDSCGGHPWDCFPLECCNACTHAIRVESYSPEPKRRSDVTIQDNTIWTDPHIRAEPFESVPYSKLIGDQTRAVFDENDMLWEADPFV